MTSETSSKTSPSTITPFRSAQEPDTTPQAESPEPNKDQPIQSTEKVDGVFVGYQEDHGHPYVAQYFDIVDTYNSDPEAYGEVETITDYLTQLIQEGELENSTEAVDKKIAAIEKLAGVDESERTVMKLVRLAEYCKFMNNVSTAKQDIKRYGRS